MGLGSAVTPAITTRVGSAPEVVLDGRTMWEAGLNAEARYKGFQFYGQFVYQDIAGLVRKGFEAEAAIPLLLGTDPVVGDDLGHLGFLSLMVVITYHSLWVPHAGVEQL